MSSTPVRGDDEAFTDLVRIHEMRAADRREWPEVGQCLRAEATRLSGDESCDYVFTQTFLESSALEILLESVFREPLSLEDRSNLLFILKNCLINGRRNSILVNGSAPNEAAKESALQVDSSGSHHRHAPDFVDEVFSRYLRLSEEFLKVLQQHRLYAAATEAEDKTTMDSEFGALLRQSVERHSATYARLSHALASSLCAMKVRIPEHRGPRFPTTTTTPYASSPECRRHSNAAAGSVGGALNLSLSLRTPVEPHCDDAFSLFDSFAGIFSRSSTGIDDAGLSPIPSAPPSRSTAGEGGMMSTVSSSTSLGSFTSPLPRIEPKDLCNHDHWATHWWTMALRKCDDVLHELASFETQQNFDEQVRFELQQRLDDIQSVATEVEKESSSLAARRDEEKRKLETLANQFESRKTILATMIDEAVAQQAVLRRKHQRLEEEARKVRVQIEVHEKKIRTRREELAQFDQVLRRESELVDRRVRLIGASQQDLERQLWISRCSKQFVESLKRKTAEQTTANFKLQEDILREQGRFAFEKVDGAMRRLGVVVAMLDTAKARLSAARGDSIVTNSSSRLAHCLVDASAILAQRVTLCREALAAIDRIHLQLKDHNLDVPHDVSHLKNLMLAVEFAAEQPSGGAAAGADGALLPMGSFHSPQACGSAAGGGMSSRALSQTDLVVAPDAAASTTSPHPAERTEGTKRMTGIPLAMRSKRVRARASENIEAGSTSLADDEGVSTAVRRIMEEVEDLQRFISGAR